MDFSYWTKMVLQPQEALKNQKDAPDWMEAIKVWAITGFWAGLATGAGTIAAQGLTGLSLVVLFSGMFGNPFIYPITYLLVEGFYFLVARLLGGTGTFLNHFYIVGLTGRILLPLAALLFALSSLPAVLAALLVSVYWLYPQTVAYRRVHGFDWTKAIFVWLIPGAILGLIGLLFVFLFLGVIASSPSLLSALNVTTG